MGELRGESRTRVLRGSWTLERWHKCCSEPTTQVDVQPQEPSSIEMVSISWLLPQPIASVHTLRCHGGHQCSGSEEPGSSRMPDSDRTQGPLGSHEHSTEPTPRAVV